MVPNEGYSAGIAKRTAKERLAWAMKGAPTRTRDLRLTPLCAIAEGRKLRDSISSKLLQIGVDPEEAVVSIIFAKSDLSELNRKMNTIPVVPSPDIEIKAVQAHKEELPIGFLVFVWDKRTRGIFGHVRPLIVEDPRAAQLNAGALEAGEAYIRHKLGIR